MPRMSTLTRKQREIQQREMSVGLGPAKGKDFNQGHVFGPWLVTADDVPDPYALDMRAEINGAVWCEASTGKRAYVGGPAG